MPKITYTITDENGIHARPAGLIVNCARRFAADIRLTIPAGEKTADAKKLFAVMSLGAVRGDTVCIEAEGEDADTALAAISEIMRQAGL